MMTVLFISDCVSEVSTPRPLVVVEELLVCPRRSKRDHVYIVQIKKIQNKYLAFCFLWFHVYSCCILTGIYRPILFVLSMIAPK